MKYIKWDFIFPNMTFGTKRETRMYIRVNKRFKKNCRRKALGLYPQSYFSLAPGKSLTAFYGTLISSKKSVAIDVNPMYDITKDKALTRMLFLY